jgi:hypothetical protein
MSKPSRIAMSLFVEKKSNNETLDFSPFFDQFTNQKSAMDTLADISKLISKGKETPFVAYIKTISGTNNEVC